MPTSALALLILTPFVAIFAYAAWHEWHRVREDGHSNYGLAYDPETDSTHVTLLEEGETGYDPETESTEAAGGDAEADRTT
ncbi:hypothetical protein [Roseovarius ramblicola]|uniref:Uncharacterized protein n=1 Tax=Roseovarius ramblicola TaxID=2022336 RepID=A0ABV5HYW7_9RHOB